MRRLKYGQHVLVRAEPEGEDVVALEEERPLLGKEQREPGQVRAPRIDFGLGEVGVDRDRRQHVGAKALGHVEAGLEFAVDVAPTARERRRRSSKPAGRSAQARDRMSGRSVSSPARLVCVTWYWRAGERPAIGFEPPLNAALHVEVPFAQVRLEAERLERNPDLGAPARRRARAVAASQMPSQSGLSFSPPGLIRPS